MNTTDCVKVLIADDEMLTRAGLGAVFETADDIEIVGNASDAGETKKLVRELTPDVILMDIQMGSEDGLSVTRWVREKHPDVKVVMLSNYDEEPLIVEAIASGASGYLLKDASRALLCHTVHAVTYGAVLFKKELLERAMRGVHSADHETAEAYGMLTERECSVLDEVAKGIGNRAIGVNLAMSESTVKKHVQSILLKLGVDNRTEAVAKVVGAGLTSGRNALVTSAGVTTSAASAASAGRASSRPRKARVR